MVSLGALQGSTGNTAFDVSLDGLVVVGTSRNAVAPLSVPYRWTAGARMVPLGLLGERAGARATNADGSVVVGSYFVGNNPFPFRWTSATGMVPLGFGGSAEDVSADGNVVVGGETPERQAYKWTPSSGRVLLGDLPGGAVASIAYGISAGGSVIVGMGESAVGQEAAVWLAGATAPVSLRNHLTALGATGHQGWWLSIALQVSGDGRTIVGRGVDPTGKNRSWVAVLPGSWSAYCTAKVNSLGCTPAIAGDGLPSATNAWPFEVQVTEVRNRKPGVFVYKVGGAQNAQPFQGGILCVGPTGIRRTIGVSSGGNAAPADDCSGVYSIDMNAFAAGLLGGQPDPALQTPGQVYHVQAWGRDQGFPPPNNTTLSNALEVPIGP